MSGLQDRFLLLWEASSYRKLLLTLAALACLILGTVDYIKSLAQTTVSHWVALPTSGGGDTMILGSPSWLWGVTLFFFFLFIWMMETALRFQRSLKPRIDVLFNPDAEGIVKSRPEIFQPNAIGFPVKIRDDQATFMRITIICLSQKTVKGCAVFLTKLEKKLIPTGAFTDIPLRGALSLLQNPIDVYPRIPTTVDFLKAGEFDKKLEGVISWPFRLDGVLNDQATYRFNMEVVGNGIAKNILVEIDWAGKWDDITGRKV